MVDDASRMAMELAWLKDNPEFRERPATLEEFLGPDYLDIEHGIRPRIREILAEIMGHHISSVKPTKYTFAMFTGAIGIGKSTVAAIVLPYLCHWVLCLKDPQAFFKLLPGSRIAFMMMSTTEPQAREVLFGDIKARIKHSPWFKKFPQDPSYKRQIRFMGGSEIWIIPGGSGETTYEGYNILGGILDEADSHKVTEFKDYAEVGLDTIDNRMSSRFGNKGFVMIIGQMKSATGFASRKFDEFETRDDAYATKLTIWESFGDDHYRDADGGLTKFYYDPARKQIVPAAVVPMLESRDRLMHIPELYRPQFEKDPEKALKDLAGIPPKVQDPFIGLPHKIHSCRERWIENTGDVSPVDPDGRIADWFMAPDSLPRVAHLDLAYSSKGDACGFAMGHIRKMIDIDGEVKPYIVIDMMWRKRALPGGELVIADIRQMIYSLRDHFNFKLQTVTYDTFQSKDTEQQLRKRKFNTYSVSVDKELVPYHDLRDAIYEGRIEMPPYLTKLRPGDDREAEVAVKELEELMDLGKKIDHPPDGSKDVADALAGVVHTLMGNRRYQKMSREENTWSPEREFHTHRIHNPMSPNDFKHPAYRGSDGLSKPISVLEPT